MPFFTGKRPFSARRKRCRPAIALPRRRELRPCRRLQGRKGTGAPYSSICHKSRRQPVSAAIGFFFLNFCTEPNGAKSPCLRDFFILAIEPVTVSAYIFFNLQYRSYCSRSSNFTVPSIVLILPICQKAFSRFPPRRSC